MRTLPLRSSPPCHFAILFISESPTANEILQEYYRLSKIYNPTNQELDKLSAILDLAQYDSELSDLINEADYLIADELGLVEEEPSFEMRLEVLI